MNQRNKQIKMGALIAYFTIAFNIIVGILYTPWMIEQIGKSDYGLYTLANSVISLFLVDFGLSSATSRFVAKYRARNDVEGMQRFLSAVYKLYLLIDAAILVAFLVVLLFCGRLYGNLTADELEKFKVVFCIAAGYSLLSFPCVTFNGILTAFEQFVPLKLSELVQRLLTVIFTVFALSLGMRLYALVTINAICGLAAICFKLWFVNKSVHIHFMQSDRSIYKEVFCFSLWSTIWSLMQRLTFNITPTVIGSVVKDATSAMAVFGVVSTIEGYFHILTSAMNGMFLSRITRITEQESNGKKLTELAIKVGRLQFCINSLVFLGFFLLGREFVQLWVGDSYSDAYICVLLVIAPGLFYNSLQIFHTAMVAQNLVKHQACIQIVMGVTNVALSIVFSYYWGVIGASLSIFVAYTIRVSLTLILINRKMNVCLNEYIRKCYGKLSIPLVISLVTGGILAFLIDTSSWAVFILKGILIVTIYFVWLFAVGLYPSEKARVYAFLRGIKDIMVR